MKEKGQLVLNDSPSYVAFVLRDRPNVSVERMCEISAEVSEIEDARELTETILRLAGTTRIHA